MFLVFMLLASPGSEADCGEACASSFAMDYWTCTPDRVCELRVSVDVKNCTLACEGQSE